MHIKVNNEGIVQDVHIEEWDNCAMPAEVKSKTLAFVGKPEAEFLVFAFTERLFLYTKMLYVMRKAGALFLWTNSTLASHEDGAEIGKMVSRFFTAIRATYAIFAYDFDEIKPGAQILAVEEFTEQLFRSNGLSAEWVEIPPQPATPDDMYIHFGMFNMTRNALNAVKYYDTDNEVCSSMPCSNQAYVVVMQKDGSLAVLPANDIPTMQNEKLQELKCVKAVLPESEEQAKVLLEAKKVFSQISRERSVTNAGKGTPTWKQKTIYIFLLLVFLSTGAGVFKMGFPLWAEILVLVVSIGLIHVFWNKLRVNES